LAACTWQINETRVCWVFSWMDQYTAERTINGDGQTVYDHEIRHCDGERHREP